MPAYITANHVAIENWVNAGGRLFINAAPNYGANQLWGFGGTVLNYPSHASSMVSSNPADIIFHGPFTPVDIIYTGNNVAHGYFTGVGLIPLLYDNAYAPNTHPVLAKKLWGKGAVFFGGLTRPTFWSPQPHGVNLWQNIISSASINETPIAIGVLDSFDVFVNNTCSGIDLHVTTANYSPGMTVETYFGENTTNTTNIIAAIPDGGFAIANHSYAASGTYTIKQVLYSGATVIDSLQFSYTTQLCNMLLVSFYFDENTNCVMDSNEAFTLQSILTEVDSNNVPIDTVSSTSAFYYAVFGNAGDVYKFKPILHAGYSVICPATGELYDTIGPNNNVIALNFGLSCASGSSFDLSVHPGVNAATNLGTTGIWINNAYCIPKDATVTMKYSPKYSIASASPAPTSNTGQTLTWDVTGVTNNQSAYLYASFAPSGPNLIAGDTVHFEFVVTRCR